MSSFNAFFIRANDKLTLASVRSGFDKLTVEQSGEFIGVRLPGSLPKTPEQMLSGFSAKFEAEVYWLGFQSAMDCFEFHHWQSGHHLRALVYGLEEEREWERAEGTPEPWEHDLFFHPKNLEYVLADAENDEHREMIQQSYRKGTIEEGKTEPGISSKETAYAIAQFYGFPFFE